MAQPSLDEICALNLEKRKWEGEWTLMQQWKAIHTQGHWSDSLTKRREGAVGLWTQMAR